MFVFELNSESSAVTLEPEYIGTHENGWTIVGDEVEEHYSWINEFEAEHPTLGRVWGDFEKKVFATSEKALVNFINNFPPEEWDYENI